MNEHIKNSGFINWGTTNVNAPSAFGADATVNISGGAQPSSSQEGQGTDIGVITVLAEEASAVRTTLGLRPDQAHGVSFDLGTLQAGGKPVTVAAIRALKQGQESTMVAYNHLRERFNPAVIVVTGIGGGIHRSIHHGDVVVATQVVYYDLRKETPEGTLRRGQERQAPAAIEHAVNRFFTDHGEPAVLSGEGQENSFRVLYGPIGSGNAVIADRDSEVLKYLARFNDKVLAIDMESGGLSHAHHEGLVTSGGPLGWLVVRGISDDAGPGKNDDCHHLAARNAALALRELLSYLPVPDRGEVR
jgi:adenosylhomocysteine nucleosidase